MEKDVTARQSECRAQEMLCAAEENFRAIMVALVDLRRRLESGDCEFPDAELRRTLTGVHKSIQAVFDERKKLDELRKATSDHVVERALDLDHAERQVRSRIARLRADLVGGPIPPDA